MAIRTYDPAKVHVSFAGNLLIGGFAAGTFIEVARNEDSFTLVVGASGEAARTMNRNRSGTVKLTLLQSSQANDILSAIAVADELAGTGVAPLAIFESNGTTAVLASNAWVKKKPDVKRGKDLDTVEWEFECESLETFAGGII